MRGNRHRLTALKKSADDAAEVMATQDRKSLHPKPAGALNSSVHSELLVTYI
jgi:hypothetical protein